MAWDEWEQLKASAAEKGPARMHLNGLPPEDRPNAGNPQGDLQVHQKDLAAIGDHAFKLYNRLWKEARVTTTDAAGTDLAGQGFALGKALQHVSTRWDKQLGSVMDACALISNHMDFTKNAHAGDEVFIERHVSSIHALDAGFDENWAQAGRKNEIYGAKDKKDKD
ncbi:hypothetical protein E2C00_34100 [Streptomyces sp. WAC05374]|uniref:hypothetical protein n=1 Tax=Streptomyces sp. WAC05374 TaxID=2487420 RepID=UPI000F87715F|nr:hypothetical protein [Streptomyces sp. WAC05374]RST11289.1 hypothetical protein EF905_25505 [Streptomyces sp. WAC05374]TDF36021.1 hypothetical protein E2B92_31650 [Streptomyces sp. WAC05374]TDF45490.1 hypothetical protein E2C02_33740 [Streptomyces sp. WAC05374]TDF46396.1 hypothetical protein E2C00_34100 [Streptomyces sp. WAC05374]